MLEQFGVDAVNMPMGDVYSAMAKGEIDGVVAPADTFKALHFAEVAHYFTDLPIPRGAYPARAMNTKRWNSLSAEQRAILDEAVPVWEAALAKEVRAALGTGFDEAKKRGVKISSMPKSDEERFDALYLADAARNARRLEKWGIDGMAAFKSARTSLTGLDHVSCGGRA